jgi:hypothetical protein
VNGYIRLGYQRNDNNREDLALGGKLHIETQDWNGFSIGTSFYTTDQLNKHDGAGVPFFDANDHSYSILGETYIRGRWGNTTLKIGRQEIDTPFADTDDVGMVPNTFEAALLVNKDITDTTLFLAYLQRWSGVDSSRPNHFTKLHGDSNVQVFGITYEGVKNTVLSGWFYHLKDNVNIGYIDANYEGKTTLLNYALSAQYIIQDYKNDTISIIYGLVTSLGYKPSGLTARFAYNKVDGRAAENFFSGGPFFTNAQHHTLSEAGKDGEDTLCGIEWNTASVGLDGFVVSANFDRHDNGTDKDTNEYDIVASYDYNDALNFTAIYSDIDDTNNAFTNLRLFVNYTF